jgi:hypothetical protein
VFLDVDVDVVEQLRPLDAGIVIAIEVDEANGVRKEAAQAGDLMEGFGVRGEEAELGEDRRVGLWIGRAGEDVVKQAMVEEDADAVEGAIAAGQQGGELLFAGDGEVIAGDKDAAGGGAASGEGGAQAAGCVLQRTEGPVSYCFPQRFRHRHPGPGRARCRGRGRLLSLPAQTCLFLRMASTRTSG